MFLGKYIRENVEYMCNLSFGVCHTVMDTNEVL